MSPQSRRMRVAAAGLVAASVLFIATPAYADGEIVFTGETSAAIEYGQFWQFALRHPVGMESEYTYVNTGTPSGFTPELYTYNDPSDGMWVIGAISAPYSVAPLKAGSYSFKVHVKQTYGGMTTFEGETPTAAQLTVTPAKLGVTVRAVPDPSNPGLALVTANFTGRFVDEYQSSFFPSAAVSPAGEWHISFVDSEGEIATAQNIERAAGDDVLATSFAWDDGEPGEVYTVSAEFVPSGASAGNFTVTPATDFSYTAAQSTRPVPTSTAAAEPDTSLPEPTGFSLPLWLLLVVGLIIIGLGVLVTILSVRLSRPSTATTGEGAA